MILSTSTEDLKAFQIKQPRYESDHRLLLGKLKLDKKKYHRTFVRKRTISPIKIRPEDKNPSDLLMDDLVTLINKPIKENPEYATWISPRSWTLVAAKAEARGCGNTNTTKRLSKSLKKSIKTDRKARIEAVALEIENSLGAGETHKAYKRLRGVVPQKTRTPPRNLLVKIKRKLVRNLKLSTQNKNHLASRSRFSIQNILRLMTLNQTVKKCVQLSRNYGLEEDLVALRSGERTCGGG
jgi:hypothetical protein